MDTVFHLLIPTAILLVLGFKKKWVLYLSPLAILPDFDYFIPIKPRGLFHNIFFVAAVFIISFILFRKDKKKVFIASFLIFGHLVLDFTGVALFYPFSEKYYGIEATITLNKKTLQVIPYFRFVVGESYTGVGGSLSEGPIATRQASLVVLLLFSSILLFKSGKFILKKLK